MAPIGLNRRWQSGFVLSLLAFCLAQAVPLLQAQSNGNQGQQPANSQPAQDIPDAPSAVQPPSQKPAFPADAPPALPERDQNQQSPDSSSQSTDQQAPRRMPPVETIKPGSQPRNQVNPAEDLGYTIRVHSNLVLLPVMIKDSDGRRVDGLTPDDFTVKEDGKDQKLVFFTADPYPLSVAIILDLGMPDVAVQKMNQTYASLVGALSPYDEAALYTYSSTVTQVSDFTSNPNRLTSVLDELKTVRGAHNGPPILGGPLGPNGPTVNGMPAGGPPVDPVNTPEREYHVLNDAILRAALDLSKRPRQFRKVIFVISDGRELGSQASYRQVLKLLETREIQIKAVVVDNGALPVFKEVEKVHHVFLQGYTDILPKYVAATGGGRIYTELSRNAIENAYQDVTSDARNQYTMGYAPQAVASSSACRSIDVIVHRKGLKVYARDAYCGILQTQAAPVNSQN
jgi:VWFA-related protein